MSERIMYPEVRKELIELLEQDQAEIMAVANVENEKKSKQEQEALRATLHEKCMARVKRVLDILDCIKTPTIANIGKEGCEAVSVLALHSNLATLKRILSLHEEQRSIDPGNVRIESIPSMRDRVSILETKRQIFGTNWFMAADGKPFLIPVEDFSTVDEKRATYGLGPIMRPRNLSPGAIEFPLGEGPAQAGDQKEMTDEEFAEYSKYLLQ